MKSQFPWSHPIKRVPLNSSGPSWWSLCSLCKTKNSESPQKIWAYVSFRAAVYIYYCCFHAFYFSEDFVRNPYLYDFWLTTFWCLESDWNLRCVGLMWRHFWIGYLYLSALIQGLWLKDGPGDHVCTYMVQIRHFLCVFPNAFSYATRLSCK